MSCEMELNSGKTISYVQPTGLIPEWIYILFSSSRTQPHFCPAFEHVDVCFSRKLEKWRMAQNLPVAAGDYRRYNFAP